jgi:hypothetical protein
MVVMKHRAGGSAAPLKHMPASAGLYHYVPSISIVEVLSAAFFLSFLPWQPIIQVSYSI